MLSIDCHDFHTFSAFAMLFSLPVAPLVAVTHSGEVRCSETSVNVTRDDVERLVNGIAHTSFEEVE